MTGNEFRETRERAGLSFREAAHVLGRSKSSIYRWEHGAEIPSRDADMIRRLADEADERKQGARTGKAEKAVPAVAASG